MVGETEEVEAAARELGKSVALVKRHEGRIAVSPGLDQLRDAFERALPIAEREADDRLDAILSEGTRQLLRKVAHNLGGREIGNVDELARAGRAARAVREQLAAGHRVRLV